MKYFGNFVLYHFEIPLEKILHFTINYFICWKSLGDPIYS